MTGSPYRRQEQEPARDEVFEVAPGVLRLMLPVDMPGLGHVNCYALEDERGVALVDPGMPGDSAWNELRTRLRRAGFPVERVHTVVVTHSHFDHFGAAGRVRAETGAEIVTHESFSTWLEQSADDDGALDLLELDEDDLVDYWSHRWQDQGPTAWGTPRQAPPPEAIRGWIDAGVGAHGSTTGPRPTSPMVDGQPVTLAGREWFALHTPGHTNDHLCLWDPAEGVLLAGDHVLPTITPHIGGPGGFDDPLDAFFESLVRVADLEGVTQVLPAHGHPFTDLAGRVAEIRKHHDERLSLLVENGAGLAVAPVDEYMRLLFRPRAWGEMAASETFAHLEHLVRIGRAVRNRDETGQILFRIAPSAD